MKKLILFLLVISLVASSFVACNNDSVLTIDSNETKTTEEAKTDVDHTNETDSSETEEINHDDNITPDTPKEPDSTPTPESSKHMLNGKRVIFIGNSYTYYGNAVITNARSELTQSARISNRGYFYQICKANGATVNVTNWTFGGHSLYDLFYNCAADRGCDGTDHKSYLVDRKYDYVFIQEHGNESDETSEEFLQRIDTVQKLFREANPDVKFFFLTQRRIYEKNAHWLSAIKKLPEKGITVVEWGALVHDVATKKTEVPGANLSYNLNSFIVNQSAKDGYHPNMLTGYITAQMAYCAITGESAVGQKYDFCTDTSYSSAFDATKHISKYYKNGATTNMLEIFQSPEDMNGLQTLMDRYLSAHYYKNY